MKDGHMAPNMALVAPSLANEGFVVVEATGINKANACYESLN